MHKVAKRCRRSIAIFSGPIAATMPAIQIAGGSASKGKETSWRHRAYTLNRRLPNRATDRPLAVYRCFGITRAPTRRGSLQRNARQEPLVGPRRLAGSTAAGWTTHRRRRGEAGLQVGVQRDPRQRSQHLRATRRQSGLLGRHHGGGAR